MEINKFMVQTIKNEQVLNSSEQMSTNYLEMVNDNRMSYNGSWGPISWDCDFHIDLDNIMASYAYVKVSVFGINVIDVRIDANNPKVTVDMTVAGVGVKMELGIDFNERLIYLKGSLNFIFYSKDFNLVIIKF